MVLLKSLTETTAVPLTSFVFDIWRAEWVHQTTVFPSRTQEQDASPPHLPPVELTSSPARRFMPFTQDSNAGPFAHLVGAFLRSAVDE
jgi:hypothetical protein